MFSLPLRPTPFPYTTLFRSPKCGSNRNSRSGKLECSTLQYFTPPSRQLLAAISQASPPDVNDPDRKSTRLNSSHMSTAYAVFCLKKKIHQGLRSIESWHPCR